MKISTSLSLYDAPVTFSIPVAYGLTGDTVIGELITPADSYFIMQSLQSASTGQFEVQRFNDSLTGLDLISDTVRGSTLFGNGQRPNVLKQPYVFGPNTLIRFTIRNRHTAANTVTVVMSGFRHYDLANPPVVGMIDTATGQKLNRRMQFFAYSFNTLLLAGNNRDFTIQILQDSRFIVHKLSGYSDGLFSLKAGDNTSKQEWSSTLIPSSAILGNAEYNRRVIQPKLLNANTLVNLSLREDSLANNNVNVVLEGCKVF